MKIFSPLATLSLLFVSLSSFAGTQDSLNCHSAKFGGDRQSCYVTLYGLSSEADWPKIVERIRMARANDCGLPETATWDDVIKYNVAVNTLEARRRASARQLALRGNATWGDITGRIVFLSQ